MFPAEQLTSASQCKDQRCSEPLAKKPLMPSRLNKTARAPVVMSFALFVVAVTISFHFYFAR